MNNTYIFISIAIMSIVTALLRFLPFLIFRNRQTPAIISYLGTVLPCAIMGMLVVYCLKGVNFTGIKEWVPALIAGSSVVGLHAWKRNTLLSIIAGTAIYMILLRMF